jgi:hypothetical protein
MDFNLWATASLQSRQPSDIIISALSGLDEVAATDPPIPMKKSGRKKRAQVSQPGASSSPDLTPSDSENMIDVEAEPSAKRGRPLSALSGFDGVAAIAEGMINRPAPLRKYGRKTRSQQSQPEASPDPVQTESSAPESMPEGEEEPAAKRARGRLASPTKGQLRSIRRKDGRILKLQRRIKKLTEDNTQLQRKLDTRPSAPLADAMRSLSKSKESNGKLESELSTIKGELAARKNCARVRKCRKGKKLNAQRKLIRRLQRSNRR